MAMFFWRKTRFVRITFTVVEDKYYELMHYCYISGLRMVQYIDYSFTILKWMLKQVREGKTIGSIGPDGSFRELDIPPFRVIREKRARGELGN